MSIFDWFKPDNDSGGDSAQQSAQAFQQHASQGADAMLSQPSSGGGRPG